MVDRHKLTYAQRKAAAGDKWKSDKERTRSRREKRRARLRELKSGGCVACGEKAPECLDFHHIDPSKKVERLSIIASQGGNLEDEAEKCIVLCANCHRKLHSSYHI